MSHYKRWSLIAIIIMLGALALAACQPQVEERIVEVTRVVTETVEREGETVEVTRVVVEEVPVTVPPDEVVTAPGTKDLVVCMAQEPDTLYFYGGSMLAARAVQHGLYEELYTNLSFDYQPAALVKLPSLEDGDAELVAVEVSAGDTVLSADGEVVTLEEGVSVVNFDGDTVEFDGTPITMEQMVVNFTMHQMYWEDGTPVTAADSVYTFNVNADPDTPVSKFLTDRTSSYVATGDLATEWTGIPGFRSSTYFINAWRPFPEHVWGQFTALELLEAPESARAPLSSGPFRVADWVAGDRIELVRNEHYYREGLPQLDTVIFKFIPDTNQLIAQLLSGQCDIGTQDGMDAGQSPFLIEAETAGILVPYFQTGTVYEHIDFNIDPVDDRTVWFDDVRVRQAMTMCTDREGMVDNILYGRSEVIHTYVPTVHPLYPEDGLTEWPYDPEQANALLDEAGYIDTDGDGFRNHPVTGERFSVTLGTTSGNEMRQQILQIFRENQAECGIDVELYFVPASEWFADGPEGPLFGRRYDLGEFAWLTGVEPACALYNADEVPSAETGWAGQNNTGWVNEEYTRICNAARGSLPGTPEYEENHKEAQRIFSENVPVIPLFLRLKIAAARPEVLNFGVDPTQNSELWNLYEIDLAR